MNSLCPLVPDKLSGTGVLTLERLEESRRKGESVLSLVLTLQFQHILNLFVAGGLSLGPLSPLQLVMHLTPNPQNCL